MKALKLFFSRGMIVALAVILQAAALAILMLASSLFSFWTAIFFVLLDIFIFFHMINKDSDPSFKLLWMFLIVLLPVFGNVLYIFLANPKIHRRENEALARIETKREAYLSSDPSYQRAMEERLGKYSGVEHLLATTAYSHGHLGNRLTYYGDGASFFRDLIESVREAHSFIFLEFFIIKRGKVWDELYPLLLQKVSEGVEVRILYDDVGTLGELEGSFCRKLEKKGICCRKFNPVRPILSGIYNYRDHRKIAVIDGRVAYTGGMNIADEYAGLYEPYGKWKDSALRIRGSAVSNFTFLFLQLFGICGPADELNYTPYFDSLPKEATAGGYVHPFGTGPEPFYGTSVAENTFLSLINSAERYLYITTPYLIMNHTVETALRNAAYRGVDVRIVTPHIPDKKIVFQMTRASYRPLLDAGVRIFEYSPGFIHAKQVIADGEIGFVGSINLDFRSLSHHFECGALICRDPVLESIRRDFDGLFEVSAEVTRENFRMNRFGYLISRVLGLFAPLF